MINIINYIAYYISCCILKKNSLDNRALLILMLLLFINLMTILSLIQVGHIISTYLSNNKMYLVTFVIFTDILIWRILKRNNYYYKIFKEFNDISTDQKKIFNVKSIIYVSLTIVLFYASIYLTYLTNRNN